MFSGWVFFERRLGICVVFHFVALCVAGSIEVACPRVSRDFGEPHTTANPRIPNTAMYVSKEGFSGIFLLRRAQHQGRDVSQSFPAKS